MGGRIDPANNKITLGGIASHLREMTRTKRIIMTACGTAFHAGLVGEFLFEQLARIQDIDDFSRWTVVLTFYIANGMLFGNQIDQRVSLRGVRPYAKIKYCLLQSSLVRNFKHPFKCFVDIYKNAVREAIDGNRVETRAKRFRESFFTLAQRAIAFLNL